YSTKPAFLLVHHVHQDVFRQHLKFPMLQIVMGIEKYIMPSVYRGGRVITVSQSTKDDLVKIGLTDPDDIAIVNPGVQLANYRNIEKTQNPSFVYVGRLKKYKN